MRDTIEKIDKNKCCACFACVNTCPKMCISMVKESCGSLYPQIDKNKCIQCGKCIKVCPVLQEIPASEPQKVLAAYSRDLSVRGLSTSGGVATEVAKYTIRCGGVVYGAAMIGMEVRHIRVTSLNDIGKIQGSKYIHSHMYDIYKQVESDLKQNIPIVFIGTPCQIAGVSRYLNDIPDNLILIDILCHGVSSLDCFLCGINLETKKAVSSVSFRDGNKYCLEGYDNGGNCIFKTPYRASYWLNGFVEGYIFRENCYSCKYAGKNRCGDITIGDFWGLKNGYDISKGVNLVAINSEKGMEFWNKISNLFTFEERKLEEAIPYNHPLREPAHKPANYDRFCNIYNDKGGMKALIKAYPNKTLYIWLRRIVRKNKRLYRIVTEIPLVGNKLKDYS